MVCDLRAPLQRTITVSDASDTGGGACVSCGLTHMGREAVAKLRTAQEMPQSKDLILISLFDGIGGAR